MSRVLTLTSGPSTVKRPGSGHSNYLSIYLSIYLSRLEASGLGPQHVVEHAHEDTLRRLVSLVSIEALVSIEDALCRLVSLGRVARVGVGARVRGRVRVSTARLGA